MNPLLLVALGAVLAVVLGLGGVYLGMTLRGNATAAPPEPEREPVAAATPDPVVATAEPASESLSTDELADRYAPAIFKVEVEGCSMSGSGSAWVLDEHHLVTNWHVVSIDPTPELVSRDGQTRMTGTVIGGRTEPDIAVIEVDEPIRGAALDWVDTDDLREGEEIVSLGYPAPAGDFSVTPSTILSFQMDGSTREAIRGDGALDDGNSGGPALTAGGEVAGVATVMVREANQLQMVPLLFTADALRSTVQDVIDDPTTVQESCDGQFAELPDEWGDDFEDWSASGPDAYGDDATLAALWDTCAAGDLEACDSLWRDSPIGSGYEAFAATCGGTSEASHGTCVSDAEWAAQEAAWEAERAQDEADRAAEDAAEQASEEQAQAEQEAALASLLSACEAGDMQACDDLFWESPSGSAAEATAADCGGHFADYWGSCVDREAEAGEIATLVGSCHAGDMQACDDLYWQSPSGSEAEAIAEDCGGRYPGEGGSCVWSEEEE
ncbi:trypsin-like peptidase domain-containing protein [Serinicoccus chungangensis]|uniref:trypsin-like peptidase domain-containing protein n=1 Tax=Serinicoccus chungangensis TaxID=767452 RepID=UPI00111A7477|nr:trypsin-like peptidase domain-containing protein [Serinicoccus chungangensis]